jgi:hypothetical protein
MSFYRAAKAPRRRIIAGYPESHPIVFGHVVGDGSARYPVADFLSQHKLWDLLSVGGEALNPLTAHPITSFG